MSLAMLRRNDGIRTSDQVAEFFYQGNGRPDASRDDAALARLRTDQMLRAVRIAAGFGAPLPVLARSGQILNDDEPGGDDARVIGPQISAEPAGRALRNNSRKHRP